MVELALGLTVGVLVFGVPVPGSVFLLFGVAGVYLLVALGIGLFISTLVTRSSRRCSSPSSSSTSTC